jgi:DNA damage-binding protein 1
MIPQDVLVAKSRRIEIRQLSSPTDNAESSASSSPFSVVLQFPINGRITSMVPFQVRSEEKSLVFFTTDRYRYAVISYDAKQPGPYPIRTHASGSLKGDDHNIIGRPAEAGPMIAMDPFRRCVAMHLYDGLLTILPIYAKYVAPKRLKGDADDDEPAKSSSSPTSKVLGEPFHSRIEERTVLALSFLRGTDADAFPQVCVLHQDARGAQHIISHAVNLQQKQLHLYGSATAPPNTEWLKKTGVDGGSSLMIPVAPRIVAASADAANRKQQTGGVVILGQRQFTYCAGVVTKVVPVPQALFLSYEELPPDPNGMSRFLIGDEFGNLHMLTLMTLNDKVVALQFDTLGSCALSTSLAYLKDGLVYIGSTLGDSQLVQIHDEPIPVEADEDVDLMDTSYLAVVEEYTNLGPILDFDLIPTTPGAIADANNVGQCQVITASGSSKSGSLRLVRNGIGMDEYASVEIPGIQSMWSIRKSCHDKDDAYLVQSFVGETRVLGVVAVTDEAMHDSDDDEVGGTLEEVELPGLISSTASLYVGNVQENDRLLQITEAEVRLFSMQGDLLDSCPGPFTVATANEAGQIAVAMHGGKVIYYCVGSDKINRVGEKLMDREVSCLDIHAFARSQSMDSSMVTDMDLELSESSARMATRTQKSFLIAVGLWDDFTVRLLLIDNNLDEAICINLGTEDEEDVSYVEGVTSQRRNSNNMMARSLSLFTLDFSASNSGAENGSSSPGVPMLFVGLGDGTLISFAVVVRGTNVSVQSKKEVCLGTQRVDLIPLSTERGGTCVLATGDRPTVIYLAGVGGTSTDQFNPKLCYSSVNLSASDDQEGDDVSRPPSHKAIAVNVATSFYSPLLFDVSALGNQHYSLCVADDSNMKLGVIDDIQKLHVTTCRLGMAPRRVVHCPDGRLFAVGCVESGINHVGMGVDEQNMGNCIRFMDDTTFDDVERIDLEPYEMILSMCYASLKLPWTGVKLDTMGADGEAADGEVYKPFLLVGTAYALPDEDEPTRGRVLLYNFQGDESTSGVISSRIVRQVMELSTEGGVYSICQFYEGKVLCSVNSKTHLCQLVDDAGLRKLQYVGTGHHGHILSLCLRSEAKPVQTDSSGRLPSHPSKHAISMEDQKQDAEKEKEEKTEMLAIVGDLMRSISCVQYYPEHETLEEVSEAVSNLM